MFRLFILSFVIFSCSEKKDTSIGNDINSSLSHTNHVINTMSDTVDKEKLMEATSEEILKKSLADIEKDYPKMHVQPPSGNYKMPVIKPDSSIKYTILIKK